MFTLWRHFRQGFLNRTIQHEINFLGELVVKHTGVTAPT